MRTPSHKMPVWAIILIDFLLLAVCVSTFCWYHHIEEIWGSDFIGDLLGDGDAEALEPIETQPPVMVITKPPRVTQPTTPSTTLPTPETNPIPDTEETGSVTTRPPEPTQPPLDTSGDFGYLHADKFAQTVGMINRGELEDGTQYYQSHDLYIETKEVLTQLEQASSKGGNKKNTTVRYVISDIYVRNIDNLFASYSSSNKSFSALLEGTGAVVAINGDVFNTGSASKEIIIRNGNVIRYKTYITSDICVLYWDGTMETITPAEFNWDELLAKAPYQVWSFGPELLRDDGSAKTNIDTSVWTLNPRSAIGYVEPGHYVMVAVDGNRGTNGTGSGLNMDELAKLMSDAGCKQAYNLDGGASVYGYYDGEVTVSFDKNRKISDIICVGEIG